MTASVGFFDSRIPDLFRLIAGPRGYVLDLARDGPLQIVSAANSAYRVGDFDGDTDLLYIAPNIEGTSLSQSSTTGGGSWPPTLVATTANITLTSDEAETKGPGTIQIVRISDGSAVQTVAETSTAVTISGSTVTINPPSALAGGVEYGVRIASRTFVDSDGAVHAGNTAAAISFMTASNGGSHGG